MGSVVYALCGLTSLVCFGLLLRSYLKNRVRLLLWSSLCFCFFGIQNFLLFVDLVLVPEGNLVFWRTLSGFIGALVLLYGLTWEKKDV